MIAFGYDAGAENAPTPKLMLRTLLFSSGERGHAIETHFLELQHKQTSRLFTVWGVDVTGLQRGSGMVVSKSGATAWHHFLPRPDERDFRFEVGNFDLSVLARVFGQSQPVLLWTGSVSLPGPSVPTPAPGLEQT